MRGKRKGRFDFFFYIPVNDFRFSVYAITERDRNRLTI